MVTKYREEYFYPEDLPPEQKTLVNAHVELIPYTVSDEELRQEELDREMNDTHITCLNALANWDSLKAAEKDALLLHLIRYRLWKEGQL